MFVVKRSHQERGMVLRVPEVTLGGPWSKLTVRCWAEGVALVEYVEVVSQEYGENGEEDGPSTVIYRGPALTAQVPGAVDEPLKARCPRCSHTWTARTRRPKRCPRCWCREVFPHAVGTRTRGQAARGWRHVGPAERPRA